MEARHFYEPFSGGGFADYRDLVEATTPSELQEIVAEMVPPEVGVAMSLDRQKRIDRIAPFWAVMGTGKVPKVPREQLFSILKDSKAEGNTCFKEGFYSLAMRHYGNALRLAKILETHHYFEVDKEIVTALFSNRAACCLKCSLFREAVDDCDYALSLSRGESIKALYRKTAALKGMGKYKDALETAHQGKQKFPASREFPDLIEELSKLVTPASHQNGQASAAKKVSSATSQTVPSGGGSRNHKQATVSASNATAIPDNNGVNMEWLAGTNSLAAVKKKKAAQAKKSNATPKSKNKKGKANQAKQKNNSSLPKQFEQKVQIRHDADESDESESGSSEEDEESESGEEEEDEEGWSESTASSAVSSSKEGIRCSNKFLSLAPGMGLDDFGAVPSKSTSLGSSSSLSSSSSNQKAAPTKPAQHPASSTRSSVATTADIKQPVKHTAAASKVTLIAAAPKEVNVETSGALSLPHPFNSLYEERLGCEQCYRKQGHGAKGYVFSEKLAAHTCSGGFLLMRHKGKGTNWIKIRPRPHWVKFLGPYRMCSQFEMDSACKVEEARCAFPHYVEERTLWTMDRNETFDLKAYLAQLQKSSSKQGSGLKVVTNQLVQLPNMSKPPPPLHSSGKAHKVAPPSGEPKMQLPFPHLKWQLVCSACFVPSGGRVGEYSVVETGHKCLQDVLALQRSPGCPWFKVRERRNHRHFYGSYVLCVHMNSEPPRPCKFGDEKCSFAHTTEEQVLWTLEKDGKFNITEFILTNRDTTSAPQGYSPEELFIKHPGEFKFICMQCFFPGAGQPRMLTQEFSGSGVCGGRSHAWADSKLLAHIQPNGYVNPIGPKPFSHKTAYFKLCHKLQYCPKRCGHGCVHAHSFPERDVFMLERDMDISREELVQKYLQWEQQQGPAAGAAPTATAGKTHTTAPQSAPPSPAHSAIAHLRQQSAKCPFRIIYVCAVCWGQGKRSPKLINKDRCSGPGNGHMWQINKLALLIPESVVIRNLPRKIPSQLRFRWCDKKKNGKPCDLIGSGCQYAHSQEEISVWTWMCMNKVSTIESLVQHSQKAHDAQLQAVPKISQGESVISAGPVPRPRPPPSLPSEIATQLYYCHYCGVNCNSRKQWEGHCSSDKHMFNVDSDKDHQWNHRQPPWAVPQGNYQLCYWHCDGGRCRYSQIPEMYNNCRYAHSQEELDEWKQRYEWRQMKRDMAKKDKLYSFMDNLTEEYEEAKVRMNVICEESDKAEIVCSQELSVYKDNKRENHSWTFKIIPKYDCELDRVALLYNKDRLHFTIVDDADKNCQIAPGDSLECRDSQGNVYYKVEVAFSAGMFGSFSQWVVFEMKGIRPVLVRKLSVEVGTREVQKTVEKLRKQLGFDRWTIENREIQPYGSSNDKFMDELQRKYEAPTSANTVVTQQSVGVELNRHNYVHKMHKLLQLEELTRHQIIARYNLCTRVELLDHIFEETIFIPCNGAELFAKVPLKGELSEDTDAGKLILTSVSRVLIATTSSSGNGNGSNSRKVYEAAFVAKENFDYDGRGRDYIYLCLSPTFCIERELKAGCSVDVEVQFQMDRKPFCIMHYAVDQLSSTDTVFPDLAKILPPQYSESNVVRLRSSILNEDQMRIVHHVVKERTGYSPPLIVWGPFGTGKTETLAQATMVLLEQKPLAKVLICTQSNSAADLYIIKHLHDYMQKRRSNALLRVYFQERRIDTVKPTVRKYCLLSPDQMRFREPGVSDIRQSRVVVTTLSTSLDLTRLQLKGHFTHIFIDEAAQALEAESIIPLSLATENTCVVLAGDSQQMSPKVHSKEGLRQRLHWSLIERLHHHYRMHARLVASLAPLNVLLRSNYRSKKEILRFISAVHYGGPDELRAESEQPTCDNIVPLTLYTAQGREVLDADKTSYYNQAEVDEVTARVEELYNNWPPEWGAREPEMIGVITPYFEQVRKIRSSLRERHRELYKVDVQRVMNVPGREYRAVFISTVRTRHLSDAASRTSDSAEAEGDGGDYGFLSDDKLLNTALTRAQSLIAVVGDPVALCAIGECVNTWRTYLKHCQKMLSIHPSNVTYDSVRIAVMNLMASPIGADIAHINERLGELAGPVIIADGRSSQSSSSTPRSSTPRSSTPRTSTPQSLVEAAQPPPLAAAAALVAPPIIPQAKPPSATAVAGLPHTAPGTILEELNVDLKIGTDTVMVHLGKEDIRSSRKTSGRREIDLNSVNCYQVHIKEEEGHAVVYYSPQIEREDEDGSGEIDPEVEQLFATRHHHMMCPTLDQLRKCLTHYPDRYFRCVLHMGAQGIHARLRTPVQENRTGKVSISSLTRCLDAFHGDEVVVEVLRPSSATSNGSVPTGTTVPEGRVLGVLRRYRDPRNRVFLCRVAQHNTSIFIPVDKHFPRIFNLVTKAHLRQVKLGQVCVYGFSACNEVVFHHYEPIDPDADDAGKFFLVRYLRWDKQLQAPVGIVLGVLPGGATVKAAADILHAQFSIAREHKPDVIRHTERTYPPEYVLPSSALTGRTDYRRKLTYTIQHNDASTDCALSVEVSADGTILVGVHVLDVDYFVGKDSPLDEEAALRGCALSNEYPMLPPRLGSDICSLRLQQDCLTVSVFLTINQQGEITKIQPRRSVIALQHQLSCSAVERVIRGTAGTDNATENITEELRASLFTLYAIARHWGRRRLGNAYLYHPVSEEVADVPEAKTLVEEILVMANHQVAKSLLERYPKLSPLCYQLVPSGTLIDDWREQHALDAINSVAMTQPFLPQGWVCECIGTCTCIGLSLSQDALIAKYVDLQMTVWEKIIAAASENEMLTIRDLIVNVEYHPQLAAAHAKLQATTAPPEYRNSYGLTEDALCFVKRNMSPYTDFTHPTTRYISLVVQRMLIAMMSGSPPAVSTPEMMTELCWRATYHQQQALRFQRAVGRQGLAGQLGRQPMLVQAVVEQISPEALQLLFPTQPLLRAADGRLTVAQLNIAYPAVQNLDKTVTYKWLKHVYDLEPDPALLQDIPIPEISLNPNRLVIHVPALQWQKLLHSVQGTDSNQVIQHLISTQQTAINAAADTRYVSDVLSEVSQQGAGLSKHHVMAALSLQPSCLVRVQLTSGIRAGLPQPFIQLLSLTSRLDLCVEHGTRPARCFAPRKPATPAAPPGRTNYPDISSYQAAWLPVLALEAAQASGPSLHAAVIHNVHIKWQAQASLSGTSFTGILTLPLSFCIERHLDFSGAPPIDGSVELIGESKPLASTACERHYDFICVRYKGILETSPADQYNLTTDKATWVGHCVSTRVLVDQPANTLTLYVRLTQSAVDMPSSLLSPEGATVACTIEWIPRQFKYRCIENAIRQLQDATDLTKDILLGRTPKPLADASVAVEEVLRVPVPGSPELTVSQSNAIRTALNQPFTLILGPAATGKSLVAAQMAYRFCQLNQLIPFYASRMTVAQKPQVLVCNPSDKALDILADYLKPVGLNVIRVYDKSAVEEIFPLPRAAIPPRPPAVQHQSVANTQHRDIALHHVIRQPGKMDCERLHQLDELFKHYPAEVSEEEVLQYRRLVARAEIRELAQANVILCSPVTMATSSLLSALCIQQVIIDDSTMCSELESFVPMVTTKAKQYVLLGDPSQHSVRVQSDVARRLGLGATLFERYQHKALPITVQYRMHETLMAFPSMEFYDSIIQAGMDELMRPSALKIWPAGRSKPLAFCHLVEKEETMIIPTIQGIETSLANVVEAKQAVRISIQMVKRYCIKAQNLMILSPYRAQCTEISHHLLLNGNRDISVDTLHNAQGGQWDYVVLSTVRSCPTKELEKQPSGGWIQERLGCLEDRHLICMALTRAKKGLIILGNKYLLHSNAIWRRFLKYCRNDGKVVLADEFLRSSVK